MTTTASAVGRFVHTTKFAMLSAGFMPRQFTLAFTFRSLTLVPMQATL